METAVDNRREFWQNGPVAGIPALLQPVAHTLLQVRREAEEIVTGMDPATLRERPRGLASAGFHLAHMTGVLDRLFTYARGSVLTDEQLSALAAEKGADIAPAAVLLERLRLQVDLALEQLAATDPQSLTEIRYVGRKKIPSTLMGLLFHAAEHLMRHTGQLLVTVKGCLNAGK